MYRGKQPYNITQCGHIYCQDCLQQAKKQCTQCGYIGFISVTLKEPLKDPNVRQLFVPFAETLEILLKVNEFRNRQMKITMQRFLELEKKYDILKDHYLTVQHVMKKLTDKYLNLKIEMDKFDKKLLFSDVQRETSRHMPSTIKTPKNSNIFIHSSSGYSTESMKSVEVIPTHLANIKRQYKTADGFRIPTATAPKRKNMMPMNSCDIDTNPNNCFIK
ncbi:hypothetical protein EAI_15734 [Harpegnathos saltator]|uniref:RING-type domain-containing protein n=2 Tax=Harpegnathos saltator TaxID=610380 RepID=E2BKC8_HARSA|nr:hypothetical protein EAI_15734 [Harpegnathos saltator]